MKILKKTAFLLALLGVVVTCSFPTPVKANIIQYPVPSAELRYTGPTMNLTIDYYAWNATHMRSKFSYSVSGVVMVYCQYVEKISTGLIVNANYTGSTGTLTFPKGSHMIRGNPLLLNGTGDSQDMALLTYGDVSESVIGEGSMEVTGILLHYWIVNATTPITQTLWIEKTTGITLRWIIPAYTIDFILKSSNTIGPEISHPADLTYVRGATGNNISWTITDAMIVTNPFTVYRNGTLIASGSWTQGTPVTVNVDGLAIGAYNYTFVTAYGIVGTVEDTVIVTVKQVDSTTIALEWIGANYILLMVAGVAILEVAIIISLGKRLKGSTGGRQSKRS